MQKFQLSAELLEEARIPKKYWSLGLTDYVATDDSARRLVIRFIKRFGRFRVSGGGIFFSGPSETGKTFLGTFILKCLLAHGHNVMYVKLYDLSQEYLGATVEDLTLRQRYGPHTDCVLVDNVCAEPGKAEINALRRFLEIRSDENLPYLIASPLTSTEIQTHYGEVIAKTIFRDLMDATLSTEGIEFSMARIHDERKMKHWRNL